MSTAGVIVAAGRGHRLGGATPKQYILLGGVCALRRSVDAFLAHMAVHRLQLVIHPEDRRLCDAALKGLSDARLLPPTEGGATRADSVLKGLEALVPSRPDRVLIHDAARPFVPAEVITAIIAALDDAPGAFAALPVVDALWRGEDRRRPARWLATVSGERKPPKDFTSTKSSPLTACTKGKRRMMSPWHVRRGWRSESFLDPS